MAENTKIEWTDHTFNPWEGCQKVGPGCDHCYAETRNARFAGGQAINWGPGAPRRRTSASNWAKPKAWNAADAEFFAQHGRRQRVFCASLGDWADNAVPVEWLVDMLEVVRLTPKLDWLLLTKRIGIVSQRLQEAHAYILENWPAVDAQPLSQWLTDWLEGDCPPANVWLGATIVNQAEADRDIPKLLDVPAAKRFLSMEPLLEAVDLRSIPHSEGEMNALQPDTWEKVIEQWRGTSEAWVEDFEDWFSVTLNDGLIGPMHPGVDWVIVGGESGPGARPMHPDWARSLRDQCNAAGVPFLFKQWGEWLPGENEPHPDVKERDGSPRRVAHHQDGRWGTSTTKITDTNYVTWDAEGTMRPGKVDYRWRVMSWAEKVGKKAAGRLLDGRTWDGFPAP